MFRPGGRPSSGMRIQKSSKGIHNEINCTGPLLAGHRLLTILKYRAQKYLGYRISEYKSDIEEKLQIYNKINGAIRRHYRKHMNKETKLRIYNVTAKAALKFGSEGLGTEEKRGTTFRSSTDKIFETLTWNNKTR